MTVERPGAAEAYDCKWGARGIEPTSSTSSTTPGACRRRGRVAGGRPGRVRRAALMRGPPGATDRPDGRHRHRQPRIAGRAGRAGPMTEPGSTTDPAAVGLARRTGSGSTRPAQTGGCGPRRSCATPGPRLGPLQRAGLRSRLVQRAWPDVARSCRRARGGRAGRGRGDAHRHHPRGRVPPCLVPAPHGVPRRGRTRRVDPHRLGVLDARGAPTRIPPIFERSSRASRRPSPSAGSRWATRRPTPRADGSRSGPRSWIRSTMPTTRSTPTGSRRRSSGRATLPRPRPSRVGFAWSTPCPRKRARRSDRCCGPSMGAGPSGSPGRTTTTSCALDSRRTETLRKPSSGRNRNRMTATGC